MHAIERLFIDMVLSAGGSRTEVRSPADQQLVGTAIVGSVEDVGREVVAARAAFDQGPWPRLGPEECRSILVRAGRSWPGTPIRSSKW